MSDCCPDSRCRRKQPIRIMRDDFLEQWFMLTRWRDAGEKGIEAIDKHRCDPLVSAALEYAWAHRDEVVELYNQRMADRGTP